jgi:hypothetical protein
MDNISITYRSKKIDNIHWAMSVTAAATEDDISKCR